MWNQEPNDYKGQEDCGVLKSNGYFNDVPCTSYRAAAICELDNARKTIAVFKILKMDLALESHLLCHLSGKP